MTELFWTHVRRVVLALDVANGAGSQETAMRLLKVQEEAGEAAAAYIGLTGQNPRKGQTHSSPDVADELCDVIVTAAVALHQFTGEPPAFLAAHIRRRTDRLAGRDG